MKAYRLWGRVEQTGASEYLAIASAVPESGYEGVRVDSRICATRELAEAAVRDLVLRLGDAIRADGSRVIDVETDGV